MRHTSQAAREVAKDPGLRAGNKRSARDSVVARAAGFPKPAPGGYPQRHNPLRRPAVAPQGTSRYQDGAERRARPRQANGRRGPCLFSRRQGRRCTTVGVILTLRMCARLAPAGKLTCTASRPWRICRAGGEGRHAFRKSLPNERAAFSTHWGHHWGKDASQRAHRRPVLAYGLVPAQHRGLRHRHAAPHGCGRRGLPPPAALVLRARTRPARQRRQPRRHSPNHPRRMGPDGQPNPGLF